MPSRCINTSITVLSTFLPPPFDSLRISPESHIPYVTLVWDTPVSLILSNINLNHLRSKLHPGRNTRLTLYIPSTLSSAKCLHTYPSSFLAASVITNSAIWLTLPSSLEKRIWMVFFSSTERPQIVMPCTPCEKSMFL